jgi:hypothetical protein
MEPNRHFDGCPWQSIEECQVSTIGEFLREIIPNWLQRAPGDAQDALRHARRASARVGAEDPRALAREADAVWQNCVDDGLHGEAFPEPLATRQGRAATGDGPAKPAGHAGKH